MGKKSQRRPNRHEKDQSGCMWSLINMLDFRQARTPQRLLSGKKRASRHVAGAGNRRNKLDLLTHPNDNCTETDGEEKTTAVAVAVADADAGKPSIKKLIEEEVFSDQENNMAKKDGEESNYENGSNKKNQKRIKKICSRSCDSIRDLHFSEKSQMECPCRQRSGNSLDLDNIMEHFFRQMHKKSTSFVKHDQPSDQANNPKPSEKLSDTIKLLISQKHLDREDLVEDGDIRASKELMDALQILSSDKELFLKFSKDPNSLLAKYLHDKRDNQVEEDGENNSISGFSDGELSNLGRSDKLVNRKCHNFFRRKVKSQESISLKEEESSQSSDKIVIPKPGMKTLCNPRENSRHVSQDSCNTIMNKEPSEKLRSIFFLSELKRRLRNAMGKEHHRISSAITSTRIPSESQNSSNTNGSFKEISGRNSLTKDHFFVEKIVRPSTGVKKGDTTDNLKGREIGKDRDNISHLRQRVSNVHIEAKSHLSEMLSNEDEDEDEDVVTSGKQLPRTIGRILSLPENNSSPAGSPKRSRDYTFVTASDEFEKINEDAEATEQGNNVSNPASQKNQNLEPQPCVTDETADIEVQVLGSIKNTRDETYDEAGDNCSTRGKIISGGDVQDVEVTEIVVQEENNAFDAYSEQGGSTISGKDQTVDESEVVDEQRDPICMNEDSCEENKMPASPSNSISRKAEDCESAADILERPSPVTVLEPLFVEDDISPQYADTPIRSLQIQFEDFGSLVARQAVFTKTFAEGNESLFGYVKEVLEACGLNWDELHVKSIYSEQLLDRSLINQVEFFPDQLCHDQQLLFDCINEALTEVYAHYFGCSLWKSFTKPNIRPLPTMKHAVREVWQGVNWHIIPLPLPRTLDQIVRKDMAKSGSWMDLRFDADSIDCEMSETILEDLMEDAILSCVNQQRKIIVGHV